MSRLVVALRVRLQRKIVSIAPILLGALLLAAVLSVIGYMLEPYLPTTVRQILDHARSGDWAAGRASLRSLFDAAGDSSGLLFVLIQVVQVLLAPIPGQLFGLLGGTLFGFWHGLALTVLGLAIGSAIAMASSRFLGDMVVRRFVPASLQNRFDHLAGTNGLWTFFLIFLLPFFPDDAICFIAGLTRLPLLHLLFACTLGRLPGIAVVTFVGADVGSGTMQIYVMAVALVLATVAWLFSEELEALFVRAS
jgi:uncharacterized membrane protein YdjX (TVP38/TMEM64 family)